MDEPMFPLSVFRKYTTESIQVFRDRDNGAPDVRPRAYADQRSVEHSLAYVMGYKRDERDPCHA